MIELVMAQDEDGLIGIGNKLPWHLKEELAFFKALTENGTVLMGKKTYESIGKPLKNRTNLIISRRTKQQVFDEVDGSINQNLLKEIAAIREEEELGVKRISLTRAKEIAKTQNKTFIIGGKQIYKEFLEEADVLHLSIIKGSYRTNTSEDVFLKLDLTNWELKEELTLESFTYKKYIRME